jgi:predicted nucleic acid-binding protein
VDDVNNARAREILSSGEALITSDHVLVEAWFLLRNRLHRRAAEQFWEGLRGGVAAIEPVSAADLEGAWAIGQAFPDQDFSLVDRTSFAVMERLGLRQVASFDNDFAIYRFGLDRRSAFDVRR